VNFEPQKLFIGPMDFLAIRLPCALLTYLPMGNVGPLVLGDRYSKLAGAEAWAAFLFASYLFGHLIFLLGSWLDEFYDWARRYTLNTQIAMLARRGPLLPPRALIWLVFKGKRNLAVDRAAKIKRQARSSLQAKDSINTFQWCKALLNAESRGEPCRGSALRSRLQVLPLLHSCAAAPARRMARAPRLAARRRPGAAGAAHGATWSSVSRLPTRHTGRSSPSRHGDLCNEP
jgi:hypothetical protein